MDNPPHPCFYGGVKQHLGVLHRLAVCKPLVIEPDPVGVVQHIDTGERLFEICRVFEAQRKGPHLPGERIDLHAGIGERDYSLAGIEQPAGDVAS